MAKPKAVRVPSDDCEVEIDGETYRPHEGEWVQLRRSQTVADLKLVAEINAFQARADAAEGDPDEAEQRVKILDTVNDRICQKLAGYVIAWNWTDDLSQPLPQPDGRPEIFQSLRQAEVMYLWRQTRYDESQAERKNDSRPLPTTSSATPRVRSRK